jgi:hypothetical protein
MTSAQWLLNDTSVASAANWTAESGSSYKLQNAGGATLNRTTSSPTPYEGAGCYRSGGTGVLFYVNTSSGASITGGTYYFDAYVYTRSSPADDGYVFNAGNDTTVEYSAVAVSSSGYLVIATYDTIDGFAERTLTATGSCPDNAWFRVQVKATAAGITEAKLFKGTNINGTTADNTLTYTAGYTSFEYLYGGEAYYFGNGGIAFDNIKFDNTAYPTRGGTAHTASASSTATATGTAAMASSRPASGSSTETATGTAAASNQRTLDGAPSITASATAGMSSTQAMSASATASASGTAAASITAVITISGSATVTASGVGAMSSTQPVAGSATVTASGLSDASIRPIVTADASATITATASGVASKQQVLAGSASATATATGTMIFITQISGSATITANAVATAQPTSPGTLYGNAEKVAGLYGSLSKPTLTTRS